MMFSINDVPPVVLLLFSFNARREREKEIECVLRDREIDR